MAALAFELDVITDSVTFAELVIRDGRFVCEFQRDPHRVAKALGVAISPEVAASVSSRDIDMLLKRLPPVSLISQIGVDKPTWPRGTRKTKAAPKPAKKKTATTKKKGSK